MKTRKRALSLTGVALIALIPTCLAMPAFAQDATTNAADGSETVVVVTGTRIRRPNLKSASPITSIDDKEVKLEGAVSADMFLKDLPQFKAGVNEYQSNGSDGTANVNLRSLGGNRSLVLIDGQRLLPQQGVDLNFIPSALIERTDVLTGGASSVYGSDAMSGVVNFIMRKRLNGVRIDSQYSIFQHTNDDSYLRDIQTAKGITPAPKSITDGQKYDFNIAIGSNLDDGRGNVTGYFGYRKMEPVLQSGRDYSACALFEPTPETFGCGGSSNHAYGRFLPSTGPSASVSYANNKDGSKTWVPNDSSFSYNYAPLNFIQRNSERYQAGGFVSYDITDHLTYSGSVMFMDDHSRSQAAPSAIWSGRQFTINCDNPLMSNDQKMKLCGSTTSTDSQQTEVAFRAAALGMGRINDMRHTDYRFTSALHGDINDAFSFDASIMYAKTIGAFNYQNDINQDKVANALQAVTSGGQIVCKGGQQGCVPVDVFSAKGPSIEAYNYIFSPTFTNDSQDIKVFNAFISGDLGKYGLTSPWTDDGIAVVLGVENRAETYDHKIDQTQIDAGLAPANGKVSAKEIFFESEIPLVSDKPLIHSLNISVGYRSSTFETSSELTSPIEKKTTTYKIEGRYAPTADILFRASYNKAARAAGISELFAPQSVGNTSLVDPCSRDTQTATLAQCKLTGVTDAQYNNKTITSPPADTGSALGGGNPDLNPEIAKTTTFGVVFTPQSLRDFTASIDYYKIRVDGYIGTIDPGVVMHQCIAGEAFYCGLIHRDPATGGLYGYNTAGGYIKGTNLNTGYLQTTGYDINASYRLETAIGEVNFALAGSYLASHETEALPGGGSYDCTGLYGVTCGQPLPKWRHNLRSTWSTPWTDKAWAPSAISLNWRYLGGTELSKNTDNPFLAGSPSVINAKIAAYNYFDLATVFNVTHAAVIRVGINNILDKAPPAIDAGLLVENGNGNTYPGTYDPLGRTIFIALSAAF